MDNGDGKSKYLEGQWTTEMVNPNTWRTNGDGKTKYLEGGGLMAVVNSSP